MRIDKNRKIPVTVFIRALGLGRNSEIIDFFGEDPKIMATLDKDTTDSVEEGLLETYRKLRPGEPPTVDSAQTHIDNLFFCLLHTSQAGVRRGGALLQGHPGRLRAAKARLCDHPAGDRRDHRGPGLLEQVRCV